MSADPLPDGLGAAVARILGRPVPPTVQGMQSLREWLAGHGVGLVPVEHPEEWSWPGHWIAVTSLERAVLMFGVPSGPLADELTRGEEIVAGYVVAAHDIDREVRAVRRSGSVVAIAVAAEAEATMRLVDSARVVAGKGIEGDRYGRGAGTFSGPGRSGLELTLIESESLADAGVTAEQARRNIVTRGIDLDALIGERFALGPVVCVGRRRAEPCAHLQRITEPGLMRRLVHRGGLRADVEVGGTVRPGDVVEPLDAGTADAPRPAS